jgi:hypothetical protein
MCRQWTCYAFLLCSFKHKNNWRRKRNHTHSHSTKTQRTWTPYCICPKYKRIIGIVPTRIKVKKVVKNGPSHSEWYICSTVRGLDSTDFLSCSPKAVIDDTDQAQFLVLISDQVRHLGQPMGSETLKGSVRGNMLCLAFKSIEALNRTSPGLPPRVQRPINSQDFTPVLLTGFGHLGLYWTPDQWTVSYLWTVIVKKVARKVCSSGNHTTRLDITITWSVGC